MAETSRVAREPVYFEGGTSALFGWFHAAAPGCVRDCVAVLCPAIGLEYTLSHRAMRHLADRLARRGIATLRFDFQGTGDSPGSDLDSGRLAAWQQDVQAAVREARRRAGGARVCVIGARLGATVAALASAQADIELMVLWNPVVKGRTYVRELQAVAASAERPASGLDGEVEGGGFLMTAQTAAALRGIDLLQQPLRAARRALLLWRDDPVPGTALSEHLATLGIAHDQCTAPGWNEMMAEPQFSQVPDAALETIVDWVATHSTGADPATAAVPLREPDASGEARTSMPIASGGADAPAGRVEELACRFGAHGHLFGILARATPAADRPVIVMFSAGSVHHVGPHRLYVTLSRALAALGLPSLRFDLEGIGDSVLAREGRENHPYPATATADARAAFDFLKERFGYRRFIALGLCSGAHTAFHAGLEIPEHEIDDLILINPLTFYWREGMSLETTQRFRDVQRYGASIRDPRFWKRLLRGEVAIHRPILVMLAHLGTLARSHWSATRETLRPDSGPRLSRDMRSIFAKKRRVTLVVSEGDPGYEILRAGARRTTRKAIRSGDIRLVRIAAADHTFSQQRPRLELAMRLAEMMVHRLPAAAEPERPAAKPSRKPTMG